MRSKFKVLVETWTDPAILLLVPCRDLDRAIELYGKEVKVYDKAKKLIYNGSRAVK